MELISSDPNPLLFLKTKGGSRFRPAEQIFDDDFRDSRLSRPHPRLSRLDVDDALAPEGL